MDAPIIEVSHLQAAASFYATITQTLGISYLCSSPARLHFGFFSDAGPVSVFILRQSPISPPRQSTLTLFAHSPAAVSNFFKITSELLSLGGCVPRNIGIEKEEEGEGVRAKTRDLDGNMLEAVYGNVGPPRRVSDVGTTRESRRVLEWQQDVARNTSIALDSSPTSSTSGSSPSVIRDSRPPVTYRRAETFPSPVSVSMERPRIVRRESVKTERYLRNDASERHREAERDFSSGMKVIGMLGVVVASAALAYAFVAGDSHSRSSDVRQNTPPRRATYDAPSGYRVVERIPARSGREAQAPQYVAQVMPAREERSMKSVYGRERRNSEVGSAYEKESRYEKETRYEVPLPIRIPGGQSSVVSQRSYRSEQRSQRSDERSHRSDERSRRSDERSQRSAERSHLSDERSSHYTRKESHASTRKPESYVSERMHYITARLPEPRERERERDHRTLLGSVVGGYAGSVAPSDSVSSVGVKRERERLRDRMRERW